jgi:hypothetical protein
MIRLTLTDVERAVVRALRHDPTIRPTERDRVEMVLLAGAGWAVPRIVAHLACHPATVRMVLEMRERTGELIAAWRWRGHELDFGVGIATSYATCRQIGFEGPSTTRRDRP